MKARSFWPLALGYVALRILLTVVIAVLVLGAAQLAGLDMPVLVGAMLAVIVQLPLAWLLLGGMRRRLTAQLAASAGERRQLRGELRAALSGEQAAQDDPPVVAPSAQDAPVAPHHPATPHAAAPDEVADPAPDPATRT